MNRDAILRKIKACLRLAASSNPHEAGAALRQAQALMAKHGVSATEVDEVGHVDVASRFRGALPSQSVASLALMCANGFGARLIVLTGDRTMFRFYGLEGAAEVASYAFTVLRRQLDQDKSKHVARVRKRANREARSEVFALAWVASIARLLPEMVLPEHQQLALDTAFRQRHPSTSSGRGRDLTTRGRTSDQDAIAGYVAGRQAKLHRGVRGAKPARLDHPDRCDRTMDMFQGGAA